VMDVGTHHGVQSGRQQRSWAGCEKALLFDVHVKTNTPGKRDFAWESPE
jgi:hypothetical protein